MVAGSRFPNYIPLYKTLLSSGFLQNIYHSLEKEILEKGIGPPKWMRDKNFTLNLFLFVG